MRGAKSGCLDPSSIRRSAALGPHRSGFDVVLSAMDPAAQRRSHFRITYPLSDRPVFHAPGVVCMIEDVSETGLTLVAPLAVREQLRPDERIQGTVLFKHAPETVVSGVVLRLTTTGAAVRFDERLIPWSHIQAEERALLTRYPQRR